MILEIFSSFYLFKLLSECLNQNMLKLNNQIMKFLSSISRMRILMIVLNLHLTQ